MTQLECHNLSAGYNSHAVITGLNLTVNAGDYLCIVGENGSGKSTLMKTLLGLIPPLEGSINIFVSRNETGYVPQQNEVQKDFPASVWEVVMSGCLGRSGLRPFYTRKEKQTAVEAIKKMNITELSGRCYRELSGGQRQRVLLARALCAAGKILFLDEPVSGLDPVAASEMYMAVNKLNQEGMTIIMISHDVNSSLKYASNILELRKR